MKIKTILFVFLAAGLLFGCGQSQSGDAGKDNEPGQVSSGSEIEAAAENQPVIVEVPANGDLVFTYHDVTYDIALSLTKVNGGVAFNIDATNSDNACHHTVKGTAKAKDGDLESREVDGETVFVQEYVYDDAQCYLTISVDMDSEAHAWISTGECKGVDPMCKLDPGTYLSLNP